MDEPSVLDYVKAKLNFGARLILLFPLRITFHPGSLLANNLADYRIPWLLRVFKPPLSG